MAYRKPSDLDGFIQQMSKADMRVKALLAEDLVLYLSDDSNSFVCMDMGQLIDSLLPWLTGSHFKIAQKSLEAFTELIKILGPDFSAYISAVLPNVIDRLGDSKDTVREKAQLLFQTLMEHKVLTPQATMDKLASAAFKHKNAKVREECLQTIVNTLNEYGTAQLSVKAYIQPICILLGDPISTVRDAAMQSLIEIYKHVGDRLRSDLRKKEDVNASKLTILEQKFDQIKKEGLLHKTAYSLPSSNGHDDTDNATVRPTRLLKRTGSSSLKIKPCSSDIATSCDAGAITMEIFEQSFELVPHFTLFHQKDMDDIHKNILIILSDKNSDWEKRVDALKRVRSLLMQQIHIHPQFPAQLKELSIAFLDILKEELRSQVIREACITIAYMSKTLRNKLDTFCVYILEQLIFLIQNSAKVIATSSTLALKYIIKFTHAPKLILIIIQTLNQSKSKDIRSSLCEILELLFEEWQSKSIERYSMQLRDTLKKSICDADNEARRHSRKAYWGFRKHFPELADQIYGNLDIATQRALERERDGTMIHVERRFPVISSRYQKLSLTKPTTTGLRSISAVDTAAAQRAKARAQYSNLARLRVKNVTVTSAVGVPSCSSSRSKTQNKTPNQQVSSVNSRGRTGVTQSQPGSRSTSPSAKLRELYPHYRQITGTIPKKASVIPRSLTNSRETSPTRGATAKRCLYTAAVGTSWRTPERVSTTRPLLAQKMLLQSRESENALADAFSPTDADTSLIDCSQSSASASIGGRVSRKLNPRDESDDSEASSVCSDRSFDSFTRGNNSNYSWSGSRNRLDFNCSRIPLEDIDTIIQFCASTHWSERKDGLVSLTQYLALGKELSQSQLQCILDMFRKMFMDSHTKVYALFLDTVTELIISHCNELHDWLFILLTRLFNKLGTELLGSMHAKIWKTLQTVNEYFPTDIQMKDIFRILSDSAQTPSTKSKIAILKFLTNLSTNYCKNDDFPSGEIQCQVDKAVLKIVQLSSDQKSGELRGQARLALIALYNCNTVQMTKVLSQLPKTNQDNAKAIIQSYLRRNTTPGANSPSSSPLSGSSPKPLNSPSQVSLSIQLHSHVSKSRKYGSYDQNSDEDIQKSLRKTTAEIQNYSFESRIDRDTTVVERQLNSLTIGNGCNGHFNLNEHQEKDSASNSKTQSATTTESNTPEGVNINHGLNQVNSNCIAFHISEDGEVVLENGLCESEIIKIACTLTTEMPPAHIQKTLKNLRACISFGNCELPNRSFRAIMKMVLNLLEPGSSDYMIDALHVLSKIIRSELMKSNWINFLELIILKIINCYQHGKELSREIDMIIIRIAPYLPLNVSINIVNPVIATGSYPMNLCAVRLLTELIEKQGSCLTDAHLESVMPNLARLTDDFQSMVRKAAVFCIVKLYIVMGEEKVKPKFSLLNPSKVRLLNVYIDKTRASSCGTGNSTKTSSASSS